jgi:hypothetical protein
MTEILAVYGAIVATIAAIGNGIYVYKNRAIVTVRISQLLPTSLFPGWALAVTAVNHGWRRITLDGGGLEFDNGRTWVIPPERLALSFPMDLGEGKSHMIWFTVEELRDAFSKGQAEAPKYGFFTTPTGRRFRSRLDPKSPVLLAAMSKSARPISQEARP